MVEVLLVDSDQTFRATVRAGLEQVGVRVKLADDAQAAVDVVDNSGCDIIVSELLLPQHNGLALLQHLRSYSDWQAIPVIVLTQLPLEKLKLTGADWQQYGVVAVLYKPELSLEHLQQLTLERGRSAARTS